MANSVQFREISSKDIPAIEALNQQYNLVKGTVRDCFERDFRPRLVQGPNYFTFNWFVFLNDEATELLFLVFESEIVLVYHDLPVTPATWKEVALEDQPENQTLNQFLVNALENFTSFTWTEIHKTTQSIDDFETLLFDNQVNLKNLFNMKKNLVHSTDSLSHLSSLVKQLKDKIAKNESEVSVVKFFELDDHCQRIMRTLDTARYEMLSLLELYWAFQSEKTNQQIKRITVFTTLIMPLTFLSSFFGMNFESIPYKSPHFFWISMSFMLGSSAVVFIVLKNKGYFDKET